MIKVHQADDGSFVVAEEGGWIPGVFDSDGAARLAAVSLSDQDIIERLSHIYETRTVTLAEVGAAIEAADREHVTDDSGECWCNPEVITVEAAK